MSFVSGLLGLAGGQNGTGVQGPSSANILNPTTVEQANQAQNNAQGALNAQQAFLQALQAQNGIQNQSNVYNQLQGVANGTGANPAQAMLNQATSANVANQAALMAGQRGTSANPGMLARQASMAGSNIQQQAAQQGAALQAQQQLGALGAMGNVAGQQVGNQSQATNALNQYSLQNQANLLGGIQGQNNANVGMQSNINNANAGLTSQTMSGQKDIFTGLASQLGGAVGTVFGGSTPGGVSTSPGARGGMAEMGDGLMAAANGGQIPDVSSDPKSYVHKHLFAEGGKVPVMLSPGEKVLSPSQAKAVAKGASPMAQGKEVPGKAKVGGAVNSYANDTYKTELEPGSIVIPRSVTQAKDAPNKAASFVEAILARNKGLKR